MRTPPVYLPFTREELEAIRLESQKTRHHTEWTEQEGRFLATLDQYQQLTTEALRQAQHAYSQVNGYILELVDALVALEALTPAKEPK